MTVNVGNPGRPAAELRGRPPPGLGGPPATDHVGAGHRRRTGPAPSWPAAPSHRAPTPTRQPPPSRPQPPLPDAPQPATRPARSAGRSRAPADVGRRCAAPACPTGARVAPTADGPGRPHRGPSDGNLATSMLQDPAAGRVRPRRPPGSIKIGRATDNDIVIPDVLASRHHATLIPTAAAGTEIRDNRSINGTFVNGARVDTALLNEGDIVTIGNVDLVFAGGTLVRRTETAAATAHRRPGRARRHLDHRGQQDAAGQHLVDGAARHADRGHRPVRCRQVHASRGWSPATPTRPAARWPSRATTSTPSTPRCAPGSGWCPRTTWCTAS